MHLIAITPELNYKYSRHFTLRFCNPYHFLYSCSIVLCQKISIPPPSASQGRSSEIKGALAGLKYRVFKIMTRSLL